MEIVGRVCMYVYAMIRGRVLRAIKRFIKINGVARARGDAGTCGMYFRGRV